MKKENRKQTRGVEKNAEIVSAARTLFLKNGFNKVSMDLIADTAKVSKRTVYSHFDNKENLFGAVMMNLCQETCASKDCVSLSDEDLSPYDILYAIGRKYLSVNLLPDAMALYRIVSSEGEQFPELAEMYWSSPRMLINHIAELLVEFDQQGKLVVPEPEPSALLLFSMLRSPLEMPMLFNLTTAPSEKEINEMVQRSVVFFLNGLKAN